MYCPEYRDNFLFQRDSQKYSHLWFPWLCTYLLFLPLLYIKKNVINYVDAKGHRSGKKRAETPSHIMTYF